MIRPKGQELTAYAAMAGGILVFAALMLQLWVTESNPSASTNLGIGRYRTEVTPSPCVREPGVECATAERGASRGRASNGHERPAGETALVTSTTRGNMRRN